MLFKPLGMPPFLKCLLPTSPTGFSTLLRGEICDMRMKSSSKVWGRPTSQVRKFDGYLRNLFIRRASPIKYQYESFKTHH